jgi:tetratricopeptide repeat protein/AAA domain-containing protein
LLTALRAALTSGQPAALTQAIYGLGGIGKTQLATEYAYRHRADYPLVCWIRAEEPTTLAADYARLAQSLKLPERGTTEQALVVEAVRAWLERHADWLLIFDNATDPTSIEPYLPYSSGHVLITSRCSAWGELATPLRVAVLPNDQAVAFLLKRTGKIDRTAAEQIVALLDALPLALAQAASYIVETSCSLADYVQLFGAHQHELLAHGRPMQYSATVTTTWSLALTQVRQQTPVAADVLSLCTYLAPDAIPLDLLHTTEVQLPKPLATVVQDTLALNQAIAALLRYSLVERTGDTLTVHRLAQAVGREQLEPEQQQAWATRAVQLVTAAFPDDSNDFRTWSRCAQLLPHALAATEYAEQLTVVPNDIGHLLARIGNYLSARGEYGAAKAAYERDLKISEAALGPDHPEVGTCLSNLGTVLHELGQLHEAKEVLKCALKISEAALGPDHPHVGTRLSNLGAALRNLGQLQEARAAHERDLKITEAAYGPDHPTTTRRRAHLSQVEQQLNTRPSPDTAS